MKTCSKAKAFSESAGWKSLAASLSRIPTADAHPPSGISVRLPIAGEVRVRDLVYRGAPRPVTKVPSVTLNRIVQCESVLEADLASILDACPGVTAFAEQAAELRYWHDGNVRWHVPDFIVRTDDEEVEFVEVKFIRDMNFEIRNRTRLLQELLRPYRINYRLVTEGTIRKGCALANAETLLVRGRMIPSELWAIQACDAVRNRGFVPLSEFSWSVSGSVEAAGIARLIIDGHLHVDMSNEIDASTLVYRAQTLNQENRLWLPAVSK